jgi:hypothetical protein
VSDNKWLLEDVNDGGDAQATTEFVAGVVEEDIKKQHEIKDDLDEEGNKKLKGMKDIQTMGRLQAMQDKAERAIVFHASTVSVEGDYMYAPGEPENIVEWLNSALDDTSPSEASDLKFIAGQLVPYMVRHNVGNAAVLWAAGFKKKARTAVPYLRFLFKQAPPDLKDKVVEVIAWIVDPKKTYRDIEDALKDARGVEPPVPAKATETILPLGMTRLVIECDDTQLISIKKRLKNLIEIEGAESEPIKKGSEL